MWPDRSGSPPCPALCVSRTSAGSCNQCPDVGRQTDLNGNDYNLPQNRRRFTADRTVLSGPKRNSARPRTPTLPRLRPDLQVSETPTSLTAALGPQGPHCPARSPRPSRYPELRASLTRQRRHHGIGLQTTSAVRPPKRSGFGP